jgi:hypothetical protein
MVPQVGPERKPSAGAALVAVFGARIYDGHYRDSVPDGGAMGRRISQQLFRKHFRTRKRTSMMTTGTTGEIDGLG